MTHKKKAGWGGERGRDGIAARPSSAARTAGRIGRPSEFSRGAKSRMGWTFTPDSTEGKRKEGGEQRVEDIAIVWEHGFCL